VLKKKGVIVLVQHREKWEEIELTLIANGNYNYILSKRKKQYPAPNRFLSLSPTANVQFSPVVPIVSILWQPFNAQPQHKRDAQTCVQMEDFIVLLRNACVLVVNVIVSSISINNNNLHFLTINSYPKRTGSPFDHSSIVSSGSHVRY